MCEIVEYTHTQSLNLIYLRNSDNRQKVDTLFGFGLLPKIIFGISIAFFWKKNMFCFLSMFLNNVEKIYI